MLIEKIMELSKQPITLKELAKKMELEPSALRHLLDMMHRTGLIQFYSVDNNSPGAEKALICSEANSYCASCPLKSSCAIKNKTVKRV